MDSDLLNAEDVATYLRLPQSTVYKFVQDKILPRFKVSRHWRFRRETIQKWVNEKENKAAHLGE